MTRRRKLAAGAFIVCFVTVSIIDATPAVSDAHARLQERLDPMLDALGLWQGDWQLFAPNPRGVNLWISARMVGEGAPLEWRSPEWRDLGPFRKLFFVRHMKFVELIRLDENRDAWEAFADYPLRQVPPEARRAVTRVELHRHWRDTPSPRVEWIPAGTHVRPDRGFMFFSKDVR